MTTDQRVARLEREIRWMKTVAAVLVAVLPAILFVGAGQDPGKSEIQEEMRAQRFVVQDKKGRERAILGMRSDGLPGLVLKNEVGQITRGVVFVLGPDTGFEWTPQVIRARKFILVDALGNERAMVSTRDDFAPVVVLRDLKGKERIRLELTELGLPRLTLSAQHKAILAVDASSSSGWFTGILELIDRGCRGLQMYDERGRTFWTAHRRR